MTLAKKLVLLLMAAGMLLAVFLESVPAQSEEMKHDMAGMSTDATSPSTEGYKAAMDKMHADMMASEYTGNADVDFVKGMIPHHQGAIDMAKVVLQYGKDDKVKSWANQIIAAQEKEIAEMQDWLKAHGE